MTKISKELLDHRGLGKTLKGILPPYVFSVLRKGFNQSLRLVPDSIKYGVATRLRKKKYPYCVIHDGDIVIQVGAPKDTLSAGRSRAMNFLRLVGNGKVIVVEPDEENCDALRRMSTKNGLSEHLVVYQKGAWSSSGVLQFLSNPNHPATNVLKVLQRVSENEESATDYNEVDVEVDTLDNLLSNGGVKSPRLISITVNGAEPEVLKGLEDTLKAHVPYISLAKTGLGYDKLMAALGYDLLAIDDRGYTFKRR